MNVDTNLVSHVVVTSQLAGEIGNYSVVSDSEKFKVSAVNNTNCLDVPDLKVTTSSSKLNNQELNICSHTTSKQNGNNSLQTTDSSGSETND